MIDVEELPAVAAPEALADRRTRSRTCARDLPFLPIRVYRLHVDFVSSAFAGAIQHPAAVRGNRNLILACGRTQKERRRTIVTGHRQDPDIALCFRVEHAVKEEL